MAGNAFVIPGYNIDLIGAGQRAKERNLAQQQQAYQNMMAGFNAVGQFGKEYAGRKFQEEEAEKARQFQAAEAAKNRQHQMEMQEAQLAAQQQYNANVKAIEDAKLAAAQKQAAQQQFAQSFEGEQTAAKDLLRAQLIAQHPDIDQYETTVPYIFPNAGEKKMGSITADVTAHNKAAAEKKAAEESAAKDEAYKKAVFASTMPKTIKTEKEKEALAERIRKSGLNKDSQTDLLNQLNSLESQQTAVKKAVQGAVAGNAGKATTEKLTEAQAKEKAQGYAGKKMNALTFNKIPAEIRAYLKLNPDGTVEVK